MIDTTEIKMLTDRAMSEVYARGYEQGKKDAEIQMVALVDQLDEWKTKALELEADLRAMPNPQTSLFDGDAR